MIADATPPDPKGPVGFIGIGQMGEHVAARLIAGGHPVVATSRNPERRDLLRRLGAESVERPADVGRRIGDGILFTMVRDGPALRSVLFGRGGAAARLRPGALVVDLSTVGPAESRAVGARLQGRGIHFLDAPVGGSVDAARDGTLQFLVGGEPNDLARVRPLLDRLGRSVELFGPVGAGSSAKLVNNLLTIGHVALLAEALAFAEGIGLDRGRALALLAGGGGHSAMLDRKRENLLGRSYAPAFRLELAVKDLRLIEAAARDAQRVVAMTREARRLAEEGVRAGHGAEDFSSVLEPALARRRSGVYPAASAA